MGKEGTRDRALLGTDRPVFRFDKIEIVLPKRAEELRDRLPLADLRAHAVTSKLHHYASFQYRAQLLIVAPDREYWELLAQYEQDLGQYKICLLELACDTFCQTELEADEAARSVMQHLRKKHHRRGLVKAVGGTSWYWEDRSAATNLAVYARADKRTGQPLMRIEWRLRRAAHIREKTGIVTISDLRDFDFQPFMTKHYQLEEIDYEQLGRWNNNIPRGAECDTVDGFTYKRAWFTGHAVCRIEDIASPADLRQYLKAEKDKLLSKRGRRTPWEEKIAALTWYKVNSFFVRVDPDWNPY